MDNAPENDVVRLTAIWTTNENGQIQSAFDVAQPVILECEYCVLNDKQLSIALEFASDKGILLFIAHDDYIRGPWGKQKAKSKGLYLARFFLPKHLFHDGAIQISVTIYSPPAAADTSLQLKQIHPFAFTMYESFNEDSARGSFPHSWGSPALRPYINYVTERT